jgi:hypothetical protein
MVCKGNMNFKHRRKKAGNRGRGFPFFLPGSFLGGGPRAKRDLLYHSDRDFAQKTFLLSVFRTKLIALEDDLPASI